MKPSPFRYERPDSVSATLDLLATAGDRAKVLAGGQSLVALMNLRLAAPAIVVDIGRCDELRYVRADGSSLAVGALTTQATIEADKSLAESCPLLAEAVRFIGHPAIRNRGTVGGSIAHADPAAELPIVLTALDGEVTIQSSSGARRVRAADFFLSFLMTAVEPDELVTEVSFPTATTGTGYAFEEYARRPGDFALVSVACCVERDGDTVSAAKVVLGGVGATPVAVDGLDRVVGQTGARAAANAGAAAAENITPLADIHATEDYRRHLARALTERAMRRAITQIL
jgi:CO/xanthine dehydrogenase FAD-binding subunit